MFLLFHCVNLLYGGTNSYKRGKLTLEVYSCQIYNPCFKTYWSKSMVCVVPLFYWLVSSLLRSHIWWPVNVIRFTVKFQYLDGKPCRYGDCDVVVDRLFSGSTFHIRGRQHGWNQRDAQQQRRQRIPQDVCRRTRGALPYVTLTLSVDRWRS